MNAGGDERLRKVRALLAKAEETSYQEEAVAYSEKAAALIAKWELDEALVWAETAPHQRGRPTARTIEVHPPYASRKGVLLGVVAGANGCQVVRTDNATTVQDYSVIGFEHDLDIVELLFSSLLVQMTSAMLSNESGHHRGSPSATAAWRRSFIVGYADTVGARLQAARRAAAAGHDRGDDAASGRSTSSQRAGASRGQSTPSVALVMQDRSDEVRDEMRRRYPRLRTSYISSGSAPDGAAAGSVAGADADLGTARLGGRRRELR